VDGQHASSGPTRRVARDTHLPGVRVMINYFSDVNSRAWQCLTTPTRVKRGLRSSSATGTIGQCDAIGYVHVLRCEGFQIILDDDRMRIRGSPGVLQVRTGMCLGLNVSWIKHCGHSYLTCGAE